MVRLSPSAGRSIALVSTWLAAWTLLVAQTSPSPQPPACPAGPLSFYQGQVLSDSGGAFTPPTYPPVQVGVALTSNPSADPPPRLFVDANGSTEKANPLPVDPDGRYSFYVAPGSYNLTISTITNPPTILKTLVDVGIVDPRKAHATGGSNFETPLTLSESTTAATTGNAALRLERTDASGNRLLGPWSLHVNQRSSAGDADFRWLYNVDWDETAQQTTPLVLNDAGFALHASPLGPPVDGRQGFSVGFDYSPSPSALGTTTPSWTTLFSEEHAHSATTNADLTITRLRGTGQTRFVIGDGLENSSLIARRYGWQCYGIAAPAGLLFRLDYGTVLNVNCGAPVCECGGRDLCDANHPCPGDVAVPIVSDGLTTAVWATTAAQQDATVYFLPGMLLTVGKALVRVESQVESGMVVINPGDVIVSSDEDGRATKDNNTITDPRQIIGFALEAANATLQGYVAIVRNGR